MSELSILAREKGFCQILGF